MAEFVRQRAIARVARNEVVNDAAAVYWFSGERIELYYDRDEGLRAAGVEPR